MSQQKVQKPVLFIDDDTQGGSLMLFVFRDWLIFRTETHTVKQIVVKGQLFYGIMEIPCSSILHII